MNLPADASNDQANCPEGYYRRSNGMLHQIPDKEPEAPQTTLSAADLARLEGMSREQLVALVERMQRQCGMVAAMSEDETAQAMLDSLADTALRPIIQGVNMRADVTARLAAIDKWLDRTRGKSIQRIEQKVEHTAKSAAGEMTTDQLRLVLMQASSEGLLPPGTKLLNDGTVTIEAEFVEV